MPHVPNTAGNPRRFLPRGYTPPPEPTAAPWHVGNPGLRPSVNYNPQIPPQSPPAWMLRPRPATIVSRNPYTDFQPPSLNYAAAVAPVPQSHGNTKRKKDVAAPNVSQQQPGRNVAATSGPHQPVSLLDK